MSRRSESNWVRTFEVASPTRHKKGFTVYKVISKVFPRTYPEGVTTLIVWKRYNDFKKLYKELQTIHRDLHLSGDFPKFPKARPFGFGRFDYEIVEERKKSAYALLEFAANHSQLFTSKIFVQFFEHGYHVKEGTVPAVAERGESTLPSHGECLVPERLWGEKEAQLLSGNEDDTVSVSSVGSSTAETATFTDSDSMISSSILSTVGETPSLMHPSNTVDFGSLSFQSSIANKSPRESGDSRSEATPSEKSSTSHQRTRAHVGIEERDSSFGESYTACGTTSAGSQSNLSLASNSKSLPSLDAISSNCSGGAGPSQSQEVVKVKRKNFKPSWSLSLRRKPNGIAGFFDFLPIFPKMAEQKKVSDEKLFSESLTSSYICEAAGHFSVAQQNESNGELPNALESYKEGIKILLVGGQSKTKHDDKDPKRRLIVRNKVEKYLSKAEQLHSSLSVGTNSSAVLFSPKKIQSILQSENSSEISKNIEKEMKSSSIEELRSYKVVGVATKGILIVVNVDERSGPKCYCVKVLQKSAVLLNPNRRTLIASQVPFMVKLIKWFDSENTIILLMQYAGGGKLADFVSTYQSKPIAIIPHDTSPCQDDTIIIDTAEGRASHNEEGSLMEGKNPTSALASAFAEQLENNSFRLNANFENEELCESYARLFQESDTEDFPCLGQDQSSCSHVDESLERRDRVESNLEEATGRRNVDRQQGGCRGKSDKACETRESPTTTFALSTTPRTPQKVGKLAVDSFHGNVDTNEALENEAKVTTTSSTGTTNTRLKANGLRKQTSLDLKVSTGLFPDNNSLISWTNLDTVDTGDLIESSKVLIQTVSRTLTQCEVFPEGGVNVNSKAMHTKAMPSAELNCGSQSSEHQHDYNNSSSKLPLPNSRICEELVSNQTESLSLSGEKQRAETNETENNNNKQQARDPLDLMNGRISKDELLEKISEETKFLGASNATTPSHYCRRPSHTSNNDPSESSEDVSPEPPIQRMVPECCVKVWVAEMVLALEKLHALGLTYGDLGMRNVLLGENGHILLSFTSQWAEVDHIPKRSDWIAPEARPWLENCEEKIHFSADWWSLGAILFYLLTGKAVQSCHPEGFHANTALKILDKNLMDEDISQHAKSLLTELLQINPNLRLGYYGAEEIKSHPFFDGFDWDSALNECLQN